MAMHATGNLNSRFVPIPSAGVLEAGVRKMRIDPTWAKGQKVVGARVVYYHIKPKGKVYLLDVFAKNAKISLSKAEKNEVRKLTKKLEAE